MIQNIAIDDYVSLGTLRDIRVVLAKMRAAGGQPRIILLPQEDLSSILDRVKYLAGMQPFAPTLCGLGVNFGTRAHPEVIGVHDDNTNTAQSIAREDEVII
jgi:hypothetical protein